MAFWFQSFRVLQAVGFKAWNTDVRYSIPIFNQRKPNPIPLWGTSGISAYCVSYIQH